MAETKFVRVAHNEEAHFVALSSGLNPTEVSRCALATILSPFHSSQASIPWLSQAQDEGQILLVENLSVYCDPVQWKLCSIDPCIDTSDGTPTAMFVPFSLTVMNGGNLARKVAPRSLSTAPTCHWSHGQGFAARSRYRVAHVSSLQGTAGESAE